MCLRLVLRDTCGVRVHVARCMIPPREHLLQHAQPPNASVFYEWQRLFVTRFAPAADKYFMHQNLACLCLAQHGLVITTILNTAVLVQLYSVNSTAVIW
jgi:hypothetical protein